MVESSPLTLLLLSLMGVLGFVQVTWALIHALMTEFRAVRIHFGSYGLGVGVYFLLLYLMEVTWEMETRGLVFRTHFFLSAALLCGYHIAIVRLARRLDREKRAAETTN